MIPTGAMGFPPPPGWNQAPPQMFRKISPHGNNQNHLEAECSATDRLVDGGSVPIHRTTDYASSPGIAAVGGSHSSVKLIRTPNTGSVPVQYFGSTNIATGTRIPPMQPPNGWFYSGQQMNVRPIRGSMPFQSYGNTNFSGTALVTGRQNGNMSTLSAQQFIGPNAGGYVVPQLHGLHHGGYYLDYNAQPQIQLMQSRDVPQVVQMQPGINAYTSQLMSHSPMVSYGGSLQELLRTVSSPNCNFPDKRHTTVITDQQGSLCGGNTHNIFSGVTNDDIGNILPVCHRSSVGNVVKLGRSASTVIHSRTSIVVGSLRQCFLMLLCSKKEYPDEVCTSAEDQLGDSLLFANALDVVKSTDKDPKAKQILNRYLKLARKEIDGLDNGISVEFTALDGNTTAGYMTGSNTEAENEEQSGYDSDGKPLVRNVYGASGSSAYMSDADMNNIQAPMVPSGSGRPREKRHKPLFERKRKSRKRCS